MNNDKEIKMKNIGNPYTKPMIVISIVCIISIAACIWSNYRLIMISKQNKDNKIEEKVKPTEEKKEKKEEPVKEEEVNITDETKLALIKKKQSILRNYTSDPIAYIKSRIYERNLTSQELIEERKLTSIIYSLFLEGKYEKLDQTKYPNIKPGKDGATELMTADSVKALYKDMYGNNLDTSTTFPEEIKESFYYSPEYNVYVINAGFGGACGERTTTFDYAFKEDSNHAYVYSSFAYIECRTSNTFIYKDFMKNETYSADGASFELNSTNYEQFHQFKITYAKKGDNYIFDKIEEIK